LIKTKVEMSEFLAVLDKAESCPMVELREWDQVYIYETIQDLVSKCDLALDTENPGVPSSMLWRIESSKPLWN
jgi:hypothetical protein